jgi:hypothetical protein
VTTRTRPLIAIRLIGPADTITTQKAHLLQHVTALYGDHAHYRTSTRPASHTGELRFYLTVTPKEVPE